MHQHMYTIRCKMGSWGDVALQHRELRLGLCDDLEGWDRRREGGDIWVIMADFVCCHMAETNTTL